MYMILYARIKSFLFHQSAHIGNITKTYQNTYAGIDFSAMNSKPSDKVAIFVATVLCYTSDTK